MIRLGHVVADKLKDRVRGLGRYDRSSRLQAAHGILVVSSFFEAFDEIVAATELQSPELTRDDQVMLAAGTQVSGDWLLVLINAPLPVPAPDRSYADLPRRARRLVSRRGGTPPHVHRGPRRLGARERRCPTRGS